jgi:hypothetical protein
MMQMMLMQSKKELEHNIANCPNEALKNRSRAELLRCCVSYFVIRVNSELSSRLVHYEE